MAVDCHNYGTALPRRWHSTAKPKKKFGTREVLLAGVREKKSAAIMIITAAETILLC
jgi:hypothetical protein